MLKVLVFCHFDGDGQNTIKGQSYRMDGRLLVIQAAFHIQPRPSSLGPALVSQTFAVLAAKSVNIPCFDCEMQVAARMRRMETLNSASVIMSSPDLSHRLSFAATSARSIRTWVSLDKEESPVCGRIDRYKNLCLALPGNFDISQLCMRGHVARKADTFGFSHAVGLRLQQLLH